MIILKKLLSLIFNLGSLIDLIIKVDKNLQDAEEQKKVQDDQKKITEAFASRDAQKLRDTFDDDQL
jgi:hypothetical protein